MEKEYYNKLEALMKELHGKVNGTADQIKRLFDLHNEYFPNKETGRSCSTCRARVYNRMKALYAQHKPTEATESKYSANDQALVDFFSRVTDARVIPDDSDRIYLQEIHNRLFPQHKEVSRNCCGCRQRMYNRLKTIYEEIIKKNSNE